MTSLTHKLFNKVDNRSIDFLLNLGSGQVSVALVYNNNQEKPLVLQTRTRTVPFNHNPTPRELQQNILKVVDVLLADFVQELGGMFELNDLYDSHQAIHAVHVALSPLWLDTQIVVHEEDFGSPTVVTQDMLQTYVEKETSGDLIDASIVFARANKYQVAPEHIVGMETPELEIQIKKSTLTKHLREEIESKINAHISTERIGSISFVPSQKVAAAIISELFGAHTDYMVMHIDGEDTHILVQSKEEGMRFDSITYGLAELKRQIIKEGIAPDFVHAQDILRAYFEDALEDSFKAQIEYILSIESQVLANLLGDMIAEKNPLFVIADKNSEDFFIQYAVQHVQHVSRAVVVESDHFKNYFTVAGAYIQPSVETLSLLTYLGMIKNTK